MSGILTKVNSLFFQVLDYKSGNVMLNKRYIASAIQTGELKAEVTMVTGQKFTLTMSAQGFGELMHLLMQVEHKNLDTVTA